MALCGLVLSLGATMLLALNTLLPNWQGAIQRHLGYGQSIYDGIYRYGGLQNDLIWPPIHTWFSDTWLELLVLALGLVLLATAILQARIMPKGDILFFLWTIASMPLYWVYWPPLFAVLFIAFSAFNSTFELYDLNRFPNIFDPLTIAAILFGLAWMRLGYKLMSASASSKQRGLEAQVTPGRNMAPV
jgi:hypothetical protein